MRALLLTLAAIALVGATAPVGSSAPAKSDGQIAAAPCPEDLADRNASCGTFTVYEDPVKRGRTIDLYFVVLKAAHPNGRAIFMNPGGPGSSTTALAAPIAKGEFLEELSALRSDYDILLLDERGMGRSHPVDCDILGRATLAERFAELWPHRALAACRADISTHSDLDQYRTSNAVDDLDRLRGALGYSKLVLDGYSYGTYTSLTYMRRHPDRVEAALLDGVIPPGILTMPLEDARGAQLAVDHLAAACAADASCRARYPHFSEQFRALAARFDRGPVLMPVKDSGQPVWMSKEVFADRLRQAMYGNAAAAYVPFVVDRADQGDFGPLATLIDGSTVAISSSIETGPNLAYACAEQLPFITPAAAARTSASTFMGDTRVRSEQRACAVWRVKPASAEAAQPVRSKLPVLMISGSEDPTSPPEFGARALKLLPNGAQVIVKGAAHIALTPCTQALKVEFIRKGSVRGLDLEKCAADFKRPPFATSMDGFQP